MQSADDIYLASQRARNAGWFDDVKGRGQPIYADPDQHNPHIGECRSRNG